MRLVKLLGYGAGPLAALGLGRYLLQPRNGRPFPRAKAQTVSVHGHAFTRVTIRYDSGIR